MALCLVTAFALVACGSVPPDPDDRAGFLAHQRERVPALMDEFGIHGVAIALVTPDGTEVDTHGLADESGTPVAGETTFRAASISKTVTALGILGLVDAAVVDLDDSVDNHLTSWQVGHDGVTVRRLLDHSSGLSDPYLEFTPIGQELPTLADELADVHLIDEPGASTHYSGGGYAVLQLLIEELTGEPFAAWADHAVLAPLEMSVSSFDRVPNARGWDAQGAPVPDYQYAAPAGAGLVTSIEDLARLVAHVLADPDAHGRLAMTEGEDSGVAQGVGAFVDTRSGTTVIGHSGQDVGWAALWLAIPAEGVGLAILTNSDTGLHLATAIGCDWTAWTLGVAVGRACP